MRLATLLLGSALLTACEGGFVAPRDGEEQTWEYTAYSAAGAPVVSGTFVVRAEGRDFTGTWATALLQPNANVGPQVGTGELRGSWDIEGQSIFFDLNPGWADNNVFLVGEPIGDALSGTWSHSTLLGNVAEGTFLARKTE
jgi:hypothetical protein